MESDQLLRLLCFLIVFSAASGFSQAITGNLTGTVADASTLAVPAAGISATHQPVGQQFTAVTTNSGEYVPRGLPLRLRAENVGGTLEAYRR